MPDEEVTVFVSGSCGPCQEVKRFIEEGKFNLAKVKVIDLETPEGFPFIAKLGLTKVPAAFKGTQSCKILSDEETLVIDCGEELIPIQQSQ
jgi:glutaredoxin